MIWNPEAETPGAGRPRRAAAAIACADAWRGRSSACPSIASAWAGAPGPRARGPGRPCRSRARRDLREHYPFGLFAVPAERAWRASTPRRAPRASRRWSATRAAISTSGARSWRASLAAAGAAPRRLLQIAYGYGLFTGGLGFHDGAEHMGLTVVPVSSGNTARQILLLQDFRPHGPRLHAVLRAAHRREPARAGHATRARWVSRYGIFGAEPWTEGDARRSSRRLWACAALRHLRAQRDHRARAWPASARGARRPARQRGSLPARDHRSRAPARRCRPGRRASSC